MISFASRAHEGKTPNASPSTAVGRIKGLNQHETWWK